MGARTSRNAPPSPAPAGRSLRLAILDDSPFVRAPEGTVHPRTATFHYFAEAVVRCGPFERADYLIPVRPAATGEAAPPLEPVDESVLRVVPTAAFDGAAGYLRRLPLMVVRNVPRLWRPIRGADLVWIKVPASNALLGGALCAVARVPRFTYIVGSARDVVAGQRRGGPGRHWAAGAAALYDAASALLARSGPARRLDAEVFSSAVSDAAVAETRRALRDPTAAGALAPDGMVRLVWAGRLAGEKGIGDLLRAVALMRHDPMPVELVVMGDGPERVPLVRSAGDLGIADRVRWLGLVGERERYFAELRRGTILAFPSRAEGVPKVLVEAMACGVPIVATRAGATAALLGEGSRGRLVPSGAPADLASAIRELVADPNARDGLRRRALAWVADRTTEAQARRLVGVWRREFPGLPWPPERPVPREPAA